MKTIKSCLWNATFACALGISSLALSQEPPKKPEPTKKPDAASKKVLAIVGGDILTVTRERIRGGTILIEDGKISAVGQDIKIPDGATIVDTKGKIVTPGFVAVDIARVGLAQTGTVSGSYTDSLDPFDRNLTLSLAIGITTGCVEVRGGGTRGPGRRGAPDEFPITEKFLGLDPDEQELEQMESPTVRDYGPFVSVCKCCGLPILPTEPIENTPEAPPTQQRNIVIKMSAGKLDGMFVTESAFLDMAPGSLTGALNQAGWRDQIAKAKKYLVDQAAHEKGIAAGQKVQPPRKPVPDEIIRLVKQEIALRISANTVTDLRDQVGLSKELGYRLVISGAAEAWVIPKELAEANVQVIFTPRRRRAPRFGEEDSSGTWIEMSRVLEQTGIPFAVSTLSNSFSLDGIAGRELSSLPLEAAFAVRGGASERAALASLTIVPARMLGLDKRVGSIEVGKDADLLVFNGDPLDYRTYVETAFVNGRQVYERSKDRILPVYTR